MKHAEQSNAKMPDESVMRAAIADRDPRFDGVFVYGVLTTGVYCRPSCPSRAAKAANVRFFRDAAAAESAGLRACRRCDLHGDGERHVGLMQGLARYIEKHADKPLSLKTLAEQAQLSPAYLQRVFKRVLGVSPKAYHDAARLRLLKDALKSGKTVLESITEAGFQSTSRVYGHATRTLGMTPSTSELYGSRERHRRTKVRTGGSVGVRSQSDCGTGAMSSCAAGRRRPWRLPLGSRTQARTYRPGTRPADVMNPPTSTFPAEVLEGVEAHGIQEALDRSGFYLSPAALAPDACAELAGLYETSETLFRATIPMARYGFGRGEYKYFARPLPPAVKPSRNLTTTGGVAIKKGGRAQKRALLNSPMRTGGRLDCLQLRC